LSNRPAYFEEIRCKAARRWDQLEQDPDLAGPWHQLFKQVQSPRHVLSELLQNADDAGATEASVRIENHVFIFEHNGEDFIDSHFASLCRFGYSNKRALHTIGFRGIGFKSIFSLGGRVDLHTPSLAVSFDHRRFTEPCWLADSLRTDRRTCIRVAIKDHHRQRELEKNLEEWLRSPVALLFFKHIRRMQINEHAVHWGSLGPGPIPESEWLALYQKEDEPFLLIRSQAEEFPAEALSEIKQERMLTVEEETEYPPSGIEIVLGAKGRLFVVLPTGVETALPFACNAPFIQDPARLKLKDPEISPTNRWLLERAGRLAASAMRSWLEDPRLPAIERAPAYGLFPDVDRSDNSLEGVCGTIVEEAFEAAISDAPLLLTEAGNLTPAEQSVILPKPVLDVWPAEQAAALLDDSSRPALSRHVEAADRQKLLRWGMVSEISRQQLLATLQKKHLPRPDTWRQLLHLWAYIAPEITGYRRHISAASLRIVPVQGKDVLYAAQETVRLGEKRLLQSDSDWQFLASHLIVLNQNWGRFLAEERRNADERADQAAQEAINAAYAILKEIGLEEASDVNKVVDQVAGAFFAQDSINIAGSVQLAQIAAKLNAAIGNAFRFLTRDRLLRSPGNTILFDEDGTLEELLPEHLRDAQFLHQGYVAAYTSCSREDWQKWVYQGRSGLLTFVPLIHKRQSIYGKTKIEEEARRRGLQGNISYRYVTYQFLIEDWDFDESNWRHWATLALADDRFWSRIADRIIGQRDVYWSQSKSARALQVATTGSQAAITSETLLPSWALRLRELPCLPDTRGFQRKPGDLLRRTPETEPFIDVEPFVQGLLDRETTRPLLDLLGVRSTPIGPDRLLDCLRALAKTDKPPLYEVEKWYRRLDQMVDTCSTADFQNVRQAFRSETIILSQDGTWVNAAGVFLSSDEEDVPGAAIIRASVQDLTLWRKIGVEERPTADLAIQWLMDLPSGQPLSQQDARRVRALLVRYPARVWEECGHWLNLAGEWIPTSRLVYSLTMQSLVPWGHLHQSVKQQTADLQRLSGEVTAAAPFSDLPPLAAHIEDRFHGDLFFTGSPERKDWLTTVGSVLRRVELDSESETKRIRLLAETLAKTSWQTTSALEIIRYIDGTPAGTARRADVIWLGEAVYVDEIPRAKLAKRVPEEIAKAFNRPDIKAALDYSFERSSGDVREYLEENFKLVAQSANTSEEIEQLGPLVTDEIITLHHVQLGTAEDEETAPDQINTMNGHAAEAVDENANGSMIDDPTDGEPDTPDSVLDGPSQARRTYKPQKPGIIERFAKTRGFKKESDERFFRDDGSWIARANGARFPWEYRNGSGDLECFYWPKDHCLEREPLQLEADVWSLIDQVPDKYALILLDIEGVPVEVTGAGLRRMRDAGDITLYPATYRIVYGHDQHA
jgi:hypothetical protein